MTDSTVKSALNRNAEILTLVFIATLDLAFSLLAIDHSIITQTAMTNGPNSLIYLLDVKSLFINTQLLNMFLMLKSLILYTTVIEIGKRIARDRSQRQGE